MSPQSPGPRTDVARNRVRVMHLITGLTVGGAETMLARLVSGMDRDEFENVVYCMMDGGPVAETILRHGVAVHSLGMKKGLPDPRVLLRFARAVRSWKPAILQTWMYHADLLGGLAGKLCGNIPVVWNLRQSDPTLKDENKMTLRIVRICASLSSILPARIVCCAEAGRRIHSRLGYAASRMLVIPNGVAGEDYPAVPDPNGRCRELFGIPADADVVSMIARYHPVKDHKTFFAAAKLFANDFPGTVFALCGHGIDERNGELMSMIEQSGVRRNTLLLGVLKPWEIAVLLARSTLTTNTSRSEGFSNVVGEAMASGTVCVVTDVGDSAYIVGDCGVVVPAGSPRELAAGWKRVVRMGEHDREALGLAGRRRLNENFSLKTAVKRYQNLYRDIAGRVTETHPLNPQEGDSHPCAE